MADATSPDTPNETPNPTSIALQIADAVTVYKGRFAGIRGPTHGTTQGYLDSYDDEPGQVFAGLIESAGGLTEKLGDTAASPPPEAGIKLYPRILRRVTVTGAASRADILKPIYVTDNQTMTLTRPSDDAEVCGAIIEWHTSTTCDVLLFGLVAQLVLGMAGGNYEHFTIGSFDHADLANGNIVTALPMPFHGKFISLHGVVEKAFTGSGGTATLNLEIGGTDVTGGTLVVSTAAGGTIGTKLDAAAITAANVFHEGDTIDLEVASASGTQTAGRVRVYAVVERLPGC